MSEHELDQLSQLIHSEGELTRKAIHEQTTAMKELLQSLINLYETIIKL